MKKSSRALRMAQPLAVVAVWAGLLGYVIPAAFSTPPAVTATSASTASGTPARPGLSRISAASPGLARGPAGSGHARTSARSGSAPGSVPDRPPLRPESAMVRVIQVSRRARRVDVTLGRQSLASDQPFASVTPYRPVRPGIWTVRVVGVAPGARQRVAMRITLVPGSSTTLVVADGRGRLAVSAWQVRTDAGKLAATSAAVPPAARAAAGPGRPAPQTSRAPITWLVLAGTGLLLGLASTTRLRHLRWARRAAAHIR